MSKGFTLIETILYITLLSFVLMSIFSTITYYFSEKLNSERFSEEDYQLLISKFNE